MDDLHFVEDVNGLKEGFLVVGPHCKLVEEAAPLHLKLNAVRVADQVEAVGASNFGAYSKGRSDQAKHILVDGTQKTSF